jgi:hypothetical protein
MFPGKAADPNHPSASHSVTVSITLRNLYRFTAMDTDYTTAITSVVALVLVLTGMVTYVLTRPSDLAPKTR